MKSDTCIRACMRLILPVFSAVYAELQRDIDDYYHPDFSAIFILFIMPSLATGIPRIAPHK